MGPIGQQGDQNPYGDAMQDVNMDDFLKMMIAELQNQDPMNPMDNAQILQQISQIREITSNDRLTNTLEAAFLGQNLSTANSLMGSRVAALGEEKNGIREVLAAGTVSQVSIENGVPKLHVGGRVLDLKDLTQIQSDDAADALQAAMAMFGQRVKGMSIPTMLQPISQEVSGRVTRVSLSHGEPVLHVQDDTREDASEFTIDPASAEIVSEATLGA
jgi:flagellar basal-body rod modification protein FlgD